MSLQESAQLVQPSYQQLVDDLAMSEARSDAILNAVTDSVITIDGDGLIESMNGATTRIFGYEPGDFLGQSISVLIPEPFGSARADTQRYLTTAAAHMGGDGRELVGRRKNGSTFPAELSLSEVNLSSKHHFTGVLRDVTDRKQAHLQLERRVKERTYELCRANDDLREEIIERIKAEERLESSLREKEVLLKEIHHRVKNNLQLISSLLNLQMRNKKRMSTGQLVDEIQARIQSISLLHEMLYHSGDLVHVDLASYIEKLWETIARCYEMTSRVRLCVDARDIKLSLDGSIYCGLLLSELMTNALKHAFPGERCGTVSFSAQRIDEAHVALAVQDDGVGLGEELDIDRLSSLGLELVQQLTAKLHGEMKIVRTDGARFELIIRDGG